MVNLVTEAQSVPITSLHIVDEFLLVGEGGGLRCHRLADGQELSRLVVFSGARVHGVTRVPVHNAGDSRVADGRRQLLVHGGKQLCLVSLDDDGCLHLERAALCLTSWLLDVAPLSDGSLLAALDTHGRLLRLRRDLSGPAAAPARCPDRCILYSGLLVPPAALGERLLVFCGTVFCQVLIWAPGDDGGDGTILHRLLGHTGVIFRLTLSPARDELLSCSDDRSVRRWRRAGDNWRRTPPTAAGAMFGHEARVWTALPAGAGRVVSVGEDSRVCLWSSSGQLERRWRAHDGASVRAAAVDAAGGRLVTGGGDGAVIVWPLTGAPSPAALLTPPAGDTARSVHSLDGDRQLMVTDAGRLILLRRRRCAGVDGSGNKDSDCRSGGGDNDDSGEVTSELVLHDSRLVSYALLTVSPDRTWVALADIDGHVITLRTDGERLVKAADRRVLEGKIYSLHWLDLEKLLICDSAGQLHVLTDVGGALSASRRHQLPPSKQRWVSAATFCPPETVVAADRDGSLHVFRPERTEPVQTLRRLLGRYGATSITHTDVAVSAPASTSTLLVTARDGAARRLCLGEDGQLRQTGCTRLPWDWVAGTVRLEGRDAVVGFHASQFVLWSVEASRELWRVDCGGGHRSWALSVSDRHLWLSWISEGSVRHVTCPLEHLRTTVVATGIQGGGTLSAALLGSAPDGGSLVALSGQDGTVRLISAGSSPSPSLSPALSPALRPLCTLRAHISAVRAVCAAGWSHLASAGGRGQLILWRLTDGGTAALQLDEHRARPERSRRETGPDDAPETRYMDLAARTEGDGVTVAAAGSDGVVRLFWFRPADESPRLSLLACMSVPGRCLLRLRWVGADRLVVGATDGVLWLCNATAPSEDTARPNGHGGRTEKETERERSIGTSKLPTDKKSTPESISKRGVTPTDGWIEPVRLPPLHQSGINALEVSPSPFTGDESNDTSLLTGGDDGALRLSQLSADGRLIPGAGLAPAHGSQVTGVCVLPSGLLVSASVDQRLCVWSAEPGSDRLTMVGCHVTAVADVKGLLHWTDSHGRNLLLVYGEGVELVRLEETSLAASAPSPPPHTVTNASV